MKTNNILILMSIAHSPLRRAFLISCIILYFNTYFQGRIEREGTSILEVTAQII